MSAAVSALEQLPAPVPDGSATGLWSTTVRRVPGDLEVGGCSVSKLAAQFGTPLYILDEADARARAAAWVSAMREAFAELAGADVYYACKAFASVGVARWMLEEGLHLDTCSEGELRIALAAGARGEQLGLHGNNKSAAEIELALDHEVAHLVVDSLAEVEMVAAAAARRGQVAAVVVRVAPPGRLLGVLAPIRGCAWWDCIRISVPKSWRRMLLWRRHAPSLTCGLGWQVSWEPLSLK